jgi:hypothetical protein
MRLLVSLSGEQQAAFEKPVVVPGERPLRPWRNEGGESCAIRQKREPKRTADSKLPGTTHGIGALLDPSMIPAPADY